LFNITKGKGALFLRSRGDLGKVCGADVLGRHLSWKCSFKKAGRRMNGRSERSETGKDGSRVKRKVHAQKRRGERAQSREKREIFWRKAC